MRLVIPGGTYTGVVLQPSKDSRMASVFLALWTSRMSSMSQLHAGFQSCLIHISIKGSSHHAFS